MENKVVRAGVLIMAAICIIISAIQTYLGWLQAVDGNSWMALGISMLITLGLAIINYLLYIDLFEKSGENVHKLILAYLLIASISFIANLNAFYSQYIRTDMITDDIAKLSIDVSELQERSKNSIKKTNDVTKLVTDVKNLKDILMRQINDEAMPSVGPRAKKVIENLESILSTKFTIPYGSPQQQANSLDLQVTSVLDNIVTAKTADSNKLLEEIDIELTLLKNNIDSVRFTKEIEDDIALKPYIIEAYNTNAEKVKSFIADENVFNYTRLKDTNEDLGTISHTFESIRQEEYRVSGVLMILLALFIDIITPTALLLLHSQSKTRGGFPKRRKGNEDTIIKA